MEMKLQIRNFKLQVTGRLYDLKNKFRRKFFGHFRIYLVIGYRYLSTSEVRHD